MVSAAVARGTGAVSSAARAFSLYIDGLDVAAPVGSSRVGTDPASVIIVDQLGQPSTLQATVQDPDRVLTIRDGADVSFVVHDGYPDAAGQTAATWFLGFLDEPARRYDGGPSGRTWTIRAVSLEALMDRRRLGGGVVISTAGGHGIGPLLQGLFSSLDPRVSVLAYEPDAQDANDSVGFGNNLIADNGFYPPTSLPVGGLTYRQAAEQLIRESGAGSWAGPDLEPEQQVYIDRQGRVHQGESGWVPSQPRAIADGEVKPTSTHATALDVEVARDMSRAVGAVYVNGGAQAGRGWVVSDPSLPGRDFLEAPGVQDATAREQAGQAYLASRRPVDRKSWAVESSQDELGGTWWLLGFTSFAAGTGELQETFPARIRMIRRQGVGPWTRLTMAKGGSGGDRSLAAELIGRQAEGDVRARSAGNLVGTLQEVALTVTAAPPTDADFAAARDGYLVLDLSTNKLWGRVNGAWKSVTLT